MFGVLKSGLTGWSAIAMITHEADPWAGVGAACPRFGRVIPGVLSRKGVDNACCRVNAPDVIGPFAGEIEIAGLINGHTAGGVQFRR